MSPYIEFDGELSEAYKKYHIKKTVLFLWAVVLIIFLIVFVPLIAIGTAFLPIYITAPFALIIFSICLAIPIGVAKTISISESLPVRVIISNNEIAALTSAHISKLNPNLNGIESLNVDGYYVADIKPISQVVKVVDFGEWYGIYFSSLHILTDYVCQKNLITKGSVEEFEKLFGGKIVRKESKFK